MMIASAPRCVVHLRTPEGSTIVASTVCPEEEM